MTLSYLEIYNENIRDLLKPSSGMLELREDAKPANTAKAMDPKVLEYFQFCEKEFSYDPYKCNLSFNKMFKFMLFQSM